MTPSETFREFAVFLSADPGFSFEEEQAMLRSAGQQMTKQNRHDMIVILKDFESGKIDYRDIQNFWSGSGARFYIMTEDVLRSFLYRARHVLQQSFFLRDIEDMRAGKPILPKAARTRLTVSENIALQDLADLICEIDLLDPSFTKDREKLLNERLTAKQKDGIMKLVQMIARNDITEAMLQGAWQKTAASDLAYTHENIAANLFRIAQFIDRKQRAST